MKKMNKKDKKEFLTDLYNTLKLHLKFDIEFNAMNEIIKKMFKVDKTISTEWTIEMLKIYTSRGIEDKKLSYCKDADINDFIKKLLYNLLENYKIKEIIFMIDKNFKDSYEKSYIWGIFFNINGNIFINYLDNFIMQNDFENAYNSIKIVLTNKKCIDKTIFDQTTFLFNIATYYLDFFTDDSNLLKFIYSLEKFLTNKVDKATFKTFFLEYI